MTIKAEISKVQIKMMVMRLVKFGTVALSCIFIGFFALVLSAMIPHKLIDANLIKSMEVIQNEEKTYPSIIKGNCYQRFDNWSAALMISILYNTNNLKPIESTICNFIETPPTENGNIVDELTSIVSEEWGGYNYERYWCGSFVILRPLFIFFSINEIRNLFFCVAITLFFGVLIMLWKVNLKQYAIPFVFTIITGYYLLNSMCIVYAWEIMIALSSVLYVLLLYKKKGTIGPMPVFFLCVGATCMYFTWLSMPVITLIFPLTLWVMLRLKENSNLYIKIYMELVVNSILWCTGYILVMLTKSFFAKLYGIPATGTDKMIFLIGTATVRERLAAISEVWDGFFLAHKVIIVLTILVVLVYLTIKRIEIKNFGKYLPILVVAAYPVVWEFIFYVHTNHGPERIVMGSIFLSAFSYATALTIRRPTTKE